MLESEKQFNPSANRPLEDNSEKKLAEEGIVFWNSPSGTVERGTKEERDVAMETYKER